MHRTALVPGLLLSLLGTILLVGPAPGALAQQSPRHNATRKFDVSPPRRHRQNLCDRQKLLYDGKIELADALRDVNLNVVLTDYGRESGASRYLFALDQDGKIPSDYPGLFAVILDELAERAGFRWRDSFGTIQPLDPGTDGNRTWTDILEWETDTYDVAVEYYSKSIERIELGIMFPEGWFDASILFVEHTGERSWESDAPFNALAVFKPFDVWVWVLIGASIVFTGLVYWLLEWLDHQADERVLQDKPMGALYLSAIAFTGHFEFRPNSHGARLVAFSLTFTALVIAAAYTADMASTLVIARQKPTFRVTNVEQAVRTKLPLCVRAKTWNEIYMRQRYGTKGVNLVNRYVTEDDVFMGLRKGECAAALTQASMWRRYEKSEDLNGDCTLKWDGVTAASIQGGFATAVDTGNLCSSLVGHVLDLHMMKMKADGFIEEAWVDHLSRVSSHTCSSDPDALGMGEANDGSEEDAWFRLGVKEMGSIFLIHAILCTFSLCFSFIRFYRRYRRLSKQAQKDVDTDVVSPGAPICANRLPDDFFDEEDVLLPDNGGKLSTVWSINNDREKKVRRSNRRSTWTAARRNSSPRHSLWAPKETLWSPNETLQEFQALKKYYEDSLRSETLRRSVLHQGSGSIAGSRRVAHERSRLVLLEVVDEGESRPMEASLRRSASFS